MMYKSKEKLILLIYIYSYIILCHIRDLAIHSKHPVIRLDKILGHDSQRSAICNHHTAFKLT